MVLQHNVTHQTEVRRSGDEPRVVLIVEDDRNVAGLLEQIVRGCNLLCKRVGDVHGAKKILESQNVDLVLLDLRLPDRPGMDLLLELRAAGNEVPVFVITGITLSSKRSELLRAGADDLLTKPFNVEEVELRIRTLLRKSRRSHFITAFDDQLFLDPGPHAAFWNLRWA